MRPYIVLVTALLCACSPVPQDASAPPEIPPIAGPPLQREIADSSEIAGPVYVEDAHALHSALVAALAQYDGSPHSPEIILSYADAFPYHGASWGIALGGRALMLSRAGTVEVRDKRPDPHATLSAPETRAASPWEQAAWRALAGGEVLVTHFVAHDMRMVGALRNAPGCVHCHDTAAPDALLGAWAYTFTEIADD